MKKWGGGRLGGLVVLFVALLTLIPAMVFSAEWVSVNGGGPQNPLIDVVEDTEDYTQIRVEIPGFYCEDIQEAGQTFKKIWVPAYGTKMEVGLPELPVVRGLLGMDPGKEVSEIEVLNVEWVDFNNYLIYPHQPDYPLNESPPPFEWDQDFYGQDVWYPEKDYQYSDIGMMRSVKVFNNHFQCFQYNPNQEHLKVASEMEVRINYDEGLDSRDILPSSHTDFLDYYSCIWNYESLNIPTGSSVCDYLIITGNDYVDTLTPLVQLLQRRGYTVDVVTTSEVCISLNPELDVFHYIQNRYMTDGISYVLLVGDVQDIAYSQQEELDPDRMAPIPYWYPGRETYEPQYCEPSDVCYSCLYKMGDDGYGSIVPAPQEDPPSHSPNGSSDREWNEWWENYDMYPDVFVGRLTADYISHIEEQVAKLIYYETKQDPPTSTPGDPWYDKMLLVAHRQSYFYHTFYDEDTDVDGVLELDYDIELPNYELLWGNAVDGPGDDNWDVMNNINGEGCFFVNYHGHGAWCCWGPGSHNWTDIPDGLGQIPDEYKSFRRDPHIELLDNNHLPVVFNMGCDMAWIDQDFYYTHGGDSVCDYWMRLRYEGPPPPDPYQGGIAAIGATRLGSISGDRRFEEALFQTMYGVAGDPLIMLAPLNNLGGVHYGTLVREYFNHYSDDNKDALQWVYHHILQGEPSMQIRNIYTEGGGFVKPLEQTSLVDEIPFEVSVHPNPVIDDTLKIGITSGEKTDVELRIYDITGRLILTNTQTLKSSEETIEIETSNLSSGVYILKASTITNDEDTMDTTNTKKFVVLR